MCKDVINDRINKLKADLTGNMMIDMEIKDEIHKLEMDLNGVVCSVDDKECLTCGS
jgi:hypothetical protein